jgi:hypothetical protein
VQNACALANRLLVLVAALGLAIGSWGCGPGNVIAKPKSVGEVDDQQATCKVAKDPLNPLIVEWPGTAKVNLDSASQRGVVVVSYAGCVLKVLNSCQAKGEYGYTGVTAARDKIDISSEDELYARLPLGVASLKGELSQGSSLRLDYIAIGQRISPEAPKEFTGDCSGATHYIRAITIGAYSLDAFARAKAGAAVEVGNAGGGGERKESDRRLRGSGDVQQCETSKPGSLQEAVDSGCGAPLLLDLAPLDKDTKGDFVASEFGANLGSLDVDTSDVTVKVDLEKIGFRDIDPDYLELLDKANLASENPKIRPQDKANMWAQVANYGGSNPKKAEADEYRKKWQTRADDLEKLKQQYLQDDAKLKKIARLDDRIVPAEKKAIYDRQFHEVYDPLQEQLALVLGSTTTSDTGSGSGSTTSSSDLKTIRFGVEGGFDYQSFGQTLNYVDASGAETLACEDCYNPGSAGFGLQVEIAFPNIPSENIGLAILGRLGTGGNVTYVSAGGGLIFNFLDSSGAVDLGLFVSYVNLVSVGGTADDSSAVTDGISYEGVSGQNGVDMRAVFRYGFPIGPVTLGFGAGLDYRIMLPIMNTARTFGCGTASPTICTVPEGADIKASGGGFGVFGGGGIQVNL